MDKTNIIIGMRIKDLRKAKGLSREQIARKIGVTMQMIEKYEKGVANISVIRLVSIAKALNKPISFFVEPIVFE